ncbi:MAG: RHS repeat domain-containing protein [Bacillota bacterium]|jgi:RHS repeat-associated protein
MAIVDRFNNQIIFKHNLFPVTNRIVNYDFDDTIELTPGVAWYFDTDYFLENANYGKDDNTSLAFCRNPNLSAVDASAFSKQIKVLPDTKYYISGYLASSLNTGTAIAKINQYEVGLDQCGYFMEEIPNSEIEIALLNGYHPWEKFETIFTTHTDANYIEIEFYNENAKGMSFLDKVRLDRAWPIITEITDSIGRKITFNYVDNFYEEDEDTYNHNPITVTIQDPALQNNVDFTYDREVLKTSMTYKYNNQNYIGNRRYPSHNGFDDGETYYKYSYNNRACEFSYTHKNTSGNYGITHQHLLKSLYLRNSKVDYLFYEKNNKHMGEEGFYTNSRVTSRDEKYYVNETEDEGGHYSRNYSYNGYYNGNHYTNETGYSNEYYSSHTLPENPDFQWICTIQKNNGLKTETYFKGSPIGLREEKEITYNSEGEKETRYFEEYDTTFPNQVTKIKTARQNTEGINTYYTGYSYNDWGGMASEIQPLTPDQWNNATIKSQNTISYTYDPVYKLPAGKTYYQNPTTQLTESTTYNNNGAVLTTTNAKGETTNYTYGDSSYPGNCTEITANLESGKQEITEISYSGAYYAFPTTIAKKYTENGINKNSTTTQGYEYIRGNVISETDATGNTTQYEYNSQGRIKKTTYPIATGKDGQYTIIDDYQYANYTLVLPEYQGRQVFGVYKSTTKTLSGQGPEIIAKSYNYYDDYSNLLISEYWDNNISIWVRTKYKYDNYGQLLWSKDAQNRQTSYLIDEWGRVKTITDPQGNKYQYTYNIYRNTKNTFFLPYMGAAENHFTETYDQRGRIISRKGYPNGSGGTVIEEKYEYDQLDNITKITDARNKNTRYQYDALGNLTKVINALNEQVDYEYNKQSKLSKIKQYQGTQIFQTQKIYDERGALISTQRPSGSPVTYKNNALGLPVQVTDASNKTTNMSYDGHNRLFETVANNDGISRYYHPIGEIEKYTVWNDISGTRIYGEGLEYNLSNTGKIKERKSGNYSVSFQNDIFGNTTKITDPFNLAINYTYDNLNRLNNVTVEGKTFHYEYYPDGMLKAVNYPPTPGGLAIRSEYTYDNLNRLKTVINKVGNGNISQYSYIYDNNGNIISVNTNGSITWYQYDDLNRLTGITRPSGEQITYNYDTRGNRTKLQVNNGGSYNTIHGTFRYNNWDELAQFTTGERTYQYKYDPEGLRTKKESITDTIRYHLDNNGQVIAESNANGQVTAQNIWGHKALARKVNGAYYYYIYNGHGDVVQVLNANGNIVNSYTYDEWGNILSKTEQISNPIRYAGEYYDEESGLYYLRARYYDPAIGRFISEDSNEGEINDIR